MARALPAEFNRADAASAGLNWRDLDRLLEQGQITKVAQGFYNARPPSQPTQTSLRSHSAVPKPPSP